jgi:glycosyltransferase involved in cell wall biosynthesis
MTKLAQPSHRLSVVVPLYNEETNVAPLVTQLAAALADYSWPWEAILVDDGSADGTLTRLREAARTTGPHVRVLALQRNFGQTAAMQAGIDVARGDVIATLDGDLQNDPADIPAMVEQLYARDLDLLSGWRRNRQDGFFLRKIPSRLANSLIRRVTGVHVHDYGCSLKVYRTRMIRQVRLYGEMHRFIPAWAATATTPARIGEMEVRHHARTRGRSKYGLGRSFKVLVDLLAVSFFLHHRAKPGHFFGQIGLGFALVAGLALGYLAVVKFVLGQDIGQRPLLLVGVVLGIAAVQFLTTGVVAEMMARTYYESTQARPYILREETDGRLDDPDAGWHAPQVTGSA